MKNKIRNTALTLLRFAPLIVCAVFMGVYLFSGKEITAESLLNFAPEEPLYAALFLVLLYAFKSLTVFFPIIILNVLGGFLFEPGHALIVNMVGVLVELTIPYWIGRASGTNFADKLCQKHPGLARFISGENQNQNFLSFFLRTLFCVPGDAVSLYFGAMKMPFRNYILSSFLGVLPSTIASTLLGTSITDPRSPMFWVSTSLTVGFAVVSFLSYFLWKRSKDKKTAN